MFNKSADPAQYSGGLLEHTFKDILQLSDIVTCGMSSFHEGISPHLFLD